MWLVSKLFGHKSKCMTKSVLEHLDIGGQGVGASIVLRFIITASVVRKFVPITETERKSSDRLISKPV